MRGQAGRSLEGRSPRRQVPGSSDPKPEQDFQANRKRHILHRLLSAAERRVPTNTPNRGRSACRTARAFKHQRPLRDFRFSGHARQSGDGQDWRTNMMTCGAVQSRGTPFHCSIPSPGDCIQLAELDPSRATAFSFIRSRPSSRRAPCLTSPDIHPTDSRSVRWHRLDGIELPPPWLRSSA